MPATVSEMEIQAGSVELDSRESDGITVCLFWNPRADSLTVTVEDSKQGESFGLALKDGKTALDAFQHPYAYRAA